MTKTHFCKAKHVHHGGNVVCGREIPTKYKTCSEMDLQAVKNIIQREMSKQG